MFGDIEFDGGERAEVVVCVVVVIGGAGVERDTDGTVGDYIVPESYHERLGECKRQKSPEQMDVRLESGIEISMQPHKLCRRDTSERKRG